ncbi:MAG: GtrA family protein [Candidatus Kerfeldbacteria bacterium CG08_land_8_20_14_0_20_40_16]|uniref:GtrA family protein n=1 Tax=Candidatus Kerfeldbacteria bacterium CG08_land_8_20_14_0_20_40_16 TaxID=2014244 RepID=A0A2H0YWM1_9BACT|nr:MAG: GtrA family protein [Candidatus Kerfeldbacteria bacterium CG08_land_8_20_14_0_20_40_16]
MKIIDRIRNNRHLQEKLIIKEIVKFALVGGFNTILDFSVYIILTRFWEFWQKNYLLANFVSFSIAATSSYILNKTWTFRDKNKRIYIQYPKFILVSVIGLLINETVLYILVTHLVIYDLLAKICAVGIAMFWNFSANKFWTFKPEKKNRGELSDSLN